MVSQGYSVELLLRALRLYTPSRSEASLAAMLKEICINDLGFEQAHIDSVGNLVSVKGTGEPKILLCGHMDTVPGQIPVRVENGFMYGRGASDAKAALIAMLLAASEFQKPTGTIIFAGLVDEEGNAAGVKHLAKSKVQFDYAIFGEPSGLENITIGYKGRLAIRLTCDVGKSTHASAPWLAKNSIEEIYGFWNAIKTEITSAEPGDGNRANSISCSLTEITGGSSHNVTPQKCKITLDIRIPTSTNCESVLEKLKGIVEKTASEKLVKASYRIEDRTEPFEANRSSPVVRALSLSIHDVCKTRATLIRKTGTGDMNVLGTALNVPVVTYGPGESHASHTPDEHVNISQYVCSIEVIEKALVHLTRLHNNARHTDS